MVIESFEFVLLDARRSLEEFVREVADQSSAQPTRRAVREDSGSLKKQQKHPMKERADN